MKYLPYIILSSLAILTGCASDPASVNSNAGITEAQNKNENTEVVVNNTNEEGNTNAVGTALELSENTNNTEVDLSSEASAQEDTSSWLTYTGEEYGFSFQYPSDWTIEEDNNNCLGLISPKRAVINEEFKKKFNDPNFGTDAYFPNDIIMCLKDANGMSLVDWVTDEVPEFEIISRDEIVIDDRPAIQLIRDNLGEWQRIYVLFDGKILSITHSPKDNEFSPVSILNTIVHSVIFLQENYSDWETYTNEEYGFSFQYPKEWSIGGNNSNHIGVDVTKLDDLPSVEKIAPKSSASPVTQSQNITEQLNLQTSKESSYEGKLIKARNVNFYQYNTVGENKTLITEYVTYINDVKVTLRYLEDSSDQNENSNSSDMTLLNIIETFQD